MSLRKLIWLAICAMSLLICAAFAPSLGMPGSSPRNNAAAESAAAHAALVRELHAAQVAARPVPLVIGGRQVCGARGDSAGARIKDLDSQKNRVDVPGDDAYVPVAWQDMVSTLRPADVSEVQGAPISVEGYLSHAVRVEDTGTGESTNCHLLRDDEVDWHIYLTDAPNRGIADAVIIETTPRTRPLHQWNKVDFDNLVNTDTRVRIDGWLMYDWQHTGVIGTQRATVWEVHPITKVEIQTASGWEDIEHQ